MSNVCQICGKESGKLIYHRYTIMLCNGCDQKIKRIQNKARAIEILGGKCVNCGYDNPVALTFHHINPDEKKLELAQNLNRSWDAIKEEVSKCALLCANCHILEHTNQTDVLIYLAAQR